MQMDAEHIKKALGGKLPGRLSHKNLLPPGRELEIPQNKIDRVKKSSVLLLLFNENDELKVCLIKRPVHMKHHAGQIALPGGKIEKGETALQTALRETEEEVGIKPEEIIILGSLSKLYIEVSRFQIQPIVGWLTKKPVFKLNKDEVEKTILFPVRNFKMPFRLAELQTISGKLQVPGVRYENEIIWGATAMILSEFTDIILHSDAIAQ